MQSGFCYLVKVSMKVKEYRSISEISQEDWSRVEDAQSPFSDWDFLKSLEDSQSIGGHSGWRPAYLTAWLDGQLIGAVVVYEKNHSYGEYIFDWSWADASIRAGIPYYPKLLCAVPFTPASCKKFLLADGQQEDLKDLLYHSVRDFRLRQKLHSIQFLFTTERENAFLEKKGFAIRESFQYRWKNEGYRDFDSFLGKLKSRKAKQIRKERRELNDIKVDVVSGKSLTASAGAEFYEYYLSTVEDKDSHAYLTKDFFVLIFERMADRIVLMKAFDNGDCIAQALFFKKGSRLFGRYWGTSSRREFLHFELCYYRGIDLAIREGLEIFESGAQGEHKIPRGFRPTITYSAHDFADQELKEAIRKFISREKAMVERQIEHLNGFLPFRAENT
jgi:uncharacterized protein